MSYRAATFENGMSLDFIRLMSHELFHIWLGGYLMPEDERSGEGDAAREVVALDPDGPAASAGLAIGDRILKCVPTRPNPPRILDSVETPYRFGLNTIASGAEVATIELERAGEKLALSVKPRLVPGGVRTSYRPGSETLERLFRYAAP